MESVNVTVPVVPGTNAPGPDTETDRSALGRMVPVKF